MRSTVVVGVAVLVVVVAPSNIGLGSEPSQLPTAVVGGPGEGLHELPVAFKVVLVASFQ